MTPCKDCTKRTVSCHSTCKDYLDWKDKLNKHNARIHKVKFAEQTVFDFKQKIIQKIKKGKRK